MSYSQLLGSFELGLIYGLVAIAVYLTFRIINFADMTVDGSFPLGAVVATTLIMNGTSPYIATLLACCAGALAGAITGLLSVRLKLLDLLASILVMTALYSINLRIMGGPNLSLISEVTLFGASGSSPIKIISILSLIVSSIIIVTTWFLNTEFGLGMKATGINHLFSRAYGIKVSQIIIVGVAISNALVALAGALFAQSKEFADISMGTGTIIVGLASVFIGEALFKTRSSLIGLLCCLIGAILYRFAITFALNINLLGLQASDINLLTSTLVIATLLASKFRSRLMGKSI